MSSPSEGQARDTVLVTGGTGYLGPWSSPGWRLPECR